MPFPPNRLELQRAGYDFIAAKTCPCGDAMEIWHTPQDKMMPMNPMPQDDSPAVSHWATCAKAQQFRRAAPTSSGGSGGRPAHTPPAAPSAGGENRSGTATTTPSLFPDTELNGGR